MVIKVLAIGDLANNSSVLKNFVKKSEINLVNFSWSGASTITDDKEDVEFLDPDKVMLQVNRINELKDDYDVCLAISSAGARIAYLADLNYIFFLVGNDIRTPPFIKKVIDPLASDNAIHNLNFFERRFYWNVYQNARICVANFQRNFNYLKKYRDDAIRFDKVAVDIKIFNKNVIPVNRKKEKFTFFSPQKIALQKGYDKILEALPYCKSDFEILQVEWFDKRNKKEIEFMEKVLESKPDKITFVPLMSRDNVARYFAFSDAVLGSMNIGFPEGIEREAVFCNRPVIAYNNSNYDYFLDGNKEKSPFLPTTRDPKDIAKIIDLVVESHEFREKLFEEEFEFIKKIGEPYQAAAEWDKLFEENFKKYKTIRRKSSSIRIKFRIWYFLIANRLYVKKLRKILKK